jgi:predicted DNA-binding transcriptional regulator YafY
VRIDRLLGIIFFLLNKGSATAGELAQRFEVAERTILRDVDALSAAGIPVYTLQGKGGGIALVERYVLRRAAMSDAEQNEILFALQSLPASGQADYAQTLIKLRALFDKTDTDWIEVDFSRWGYAGPDRERFETLKRAIIEKRAIVFNYTGACKKSESRKVCPLKLVFKARSWYLQAWCTEREGYRTFKVSRMRQLSACAEAFDSAAYSAPPIDNGERIQENPSDVVLKFSPRSSHRVYDEYDESCIAWHEDGACTVSIREPIDGWLCGYILSFGADVEVLGPETLRGEVVRIAGEIIARHTS